MNFFVVDLAQHRDCDEKEEDDDSCPLITTRHSFNRCVVLFLLLPLEIAGCSSFFLLLDIPVRTSTLVDGRAVQGKGKKKGLYRMYCKQMFYVWYT